MIRYAIRFHGFWLADFNNQRLDWTALPHKRLVMDEQLAVTVASIIPRGNTTGLQLVPVKISTLS